MVLPIRRVAGRGTKASTLHQVALGFAVALLGSFGGPAGLSTDAGPRDSCAASREDGVEDLTLPAGPGDRRSAKLILGDVDFVAWRRLVVLEALCELLGMIENS